MIAAFLNRGNAAGVRALNDIDQALGLLGAALFHHVAVLDKGNADLRVHITQNVKANAAHIALNFDNVLLAAFLAADILQQGHAGFVQLFQLHQMVQGQAGACGDMVNDHAVLNLINLQHRKLPPQF